MGHLAPALRRQTVRLFAFAHTACGVVALLDGLEEIAVISHHPVHVLCARQAA
jgi:hypothetical protein